MFENSIETVGTYTRPVNTFLKTYSGKKIIPGSSTLFFVTNEGYTVTCKHVIDLLASSEKINQTYAEFKKERDGIAKDGKFKMNLKGLELKYKYSTETIV